MRVFRCGAVSLSEASSQLATLRHSASSMAISTLGVLYILRGFVYSSENADSLRWAIWANPLGWLTETNAATAPRWWPLLLAVTLTIVLLAIAFAMDRHRDFGQGMIAQPAGHANGRIHGPMWLIVRLNRGTFTAWALGFVLLGVIFAQLSRGVTDLLAHNPALATVLASGKSSSLINEFFMTILSMMGIFAAISGVQTMQRLRTEEMANRIEPLIAAGLGRTRLFLTSVFVAVASSAAYVMIGGISLGLASSQISVHDAGTQALATVPATLAVVSMAVFIIGARPTIVIASWAGVPASFDLTILGPSFGLPDWMLGISPFDHVPNIVSESPSYVGVGVVGLIFLVLTAAGTRGFATRDLATQ